MLNDLLVAAESHPQAPSVPAQPGPPVLNSSSNASNISPLTPSKAQMHAENALQVALKSQDELLHITLYDWMLRRQMLDQITRVDSPFIEQFLQRTSEAQDNIPNLITADLLWKWYERNGKHLNVAQVLISLAEKVGPQRNLEKRIELLS